MNGVIAMVLLYVRKTMIKYLGISVDRSLTYSPHQEGVSKKTKPRLNIITWNQLCLRRNGSKYPSGLCYPPLPETFIVNSELDSQLPGASRTMVSPIGVRCDTRGSEKGRQMRDIGKQLMERLPCNVPDPQPSIQEAILN